MTMEARRYLVSGRVQGVGYRYFVVREAKALAVSGWARNLMDGRVEVVAVGEDAVLHVFEGRLWQGPPHARVSALESAPADAPGWTDFRVLPTPW
jgi:acylphosphatase